MDGPDVVIVGSCMIDLVSIVPRLPKIGETLMGSKFLKGFGGKGANQCIVASRLGVSTAMVGKVGDDTFGHEYLKNFKDNHILTDHVFVTSAASTGVAGITVTEKGENAITIVSGANLLLSVEDVERSHHVIKDAKILVCQLEIQQETTLAALKLAKAHGVFTILNTAPAPANVNKELFMYSDIVCPNETEAEVLVGFPIDSLESAHKAIQAMLEMGCGQVILTMGEKGAVFASNENPQPVHVPCQKVVPVDTTGAGDAFIGALAYYLATMPKLGMQESIRRSSAIATKSVEKLGTQTSFPFKKDLPADMFTE